jgi:peroxiredoxin Q/BCP
MVEVGQKAPDFAVKNHQGVIKTLSDFAGKRLVLYFYPKDDTSGCTIEAKDFTELAASFAQKGVAVVGVSRDSVASHCKFIDKHALNLELLSDEEGIMCDAYGVWVEKSMYGKKYMGIERTTLLIDEQGVVQRIWSKVQVKAHAEQVLAAI